MEQEISIPKNIHIAVKLQLIMIPVFVLSIILTEFLISCFWMKIYSIIWILGCISCLYIVWVIFIKKEVILLPFDLWRIRRVTKKNGITASEKLYLRYASKFRQITFAVMELPSIILLIVFIMILVSPCEAPNIH